MKDGCRCGLKMRDFLDSSGGGRGGVLKAQLLVEICIGDVFTP